MLNQISSMTLKRINYLLPCIKSISNKVKKSFTDFFSVEEIHQFIDRLLLKGITWNILKFLDLLESLKIEDLSSLIQIKVLLAISFVLINTGKFHNYSTTNIIKEQYRKSINEFKEALKGKKDYRNQEGIVCTSLSCLSKYNFPDFTDQIVRKNYFCKNFRDTL